MHSAGIVSEKHIDVIKEKTLKAFQPYTPLFNLTVVLPGSALNLICLVLWAGLYSLEMNPD